MKESRTKNTIRNSSLGIITQVLNTILAFVVRTVFIKILGEEYLGINGLFTNILTVLSFAELGIGNAIIYSMYKPIAEENHEKIKGLMHLYKKAYRIIGIIVLGLGILVIPFIKFIIKDPPNISENLIIIYLLFLLNTGLSYFFTYKKSIISGYQKEYIISKYTIIFYIIKSILQIVFLLLTHNFMVFLIIQILCTLLENIALSIKADKMYAYLKSKDYEEISKEEKNVIFKNVESLVVYKFGSVILNGTDNIIISKMIGIVTVGIYSNYLLIVHAISNILSTAIASFTASVGNLNVTANKEQKEKVFYEMVFISAWIFGFCSIALLLLLNPFIKIWAGENFVFGFSTVFAIVLHFYVTGVQSPGYIYRITAGLFVKGKKAPIIAAIINIILSILLGYKFGITGILISTSIARLVTTTWYDPYIVHKNEFGTSPIKFFKEYIFYFAVIVINYCICYFITSFLGEGILNLILKGIVIIICSNTIFYLFFNRKEEFKSMVNRLKKVMRLKEN